RQRKVSLLMDAGADVTVQMTSPAANLVVANVLDNALKFSPSGGEIRIRVAKEEGAAVVAVSDSGPGVLPDELPRLFERFYRGSPARDSDAPGSGLGLAICRLLLEAQGGDISIGNAPGAGTTVRVRLPLAS